MVNIVGAEASGTGFNGAALHELGPRYEASQHGVYVDALESALANSGRHAPRNIAVTGPYGSGKSSVLDGLTQRLTTAKRQVVSISLLSLRTVGTRSAADDGTAEREISNEIQKEIVKQLLYREPPSRMRSSRYHRIHPFRPRPALAGSLAIAVTFAAVVELAGKPTRLAHSVELLVAAAVVLAIVLVAAQWYFAGRVWLDKLTAGPATINLSKSSESFFDDYLDEIVYFFTASRCRVSIFEDLDRFNNAHIFETLRGLNTILNTAKQLKPDQQPVRFIYAVRDSIFDLLDDGNDEPEPVLRSVVGLPQDHPSTSRTKFFDLVVPLVPFITSRTSRDLMTKVMKTSADSPGPNGHELGHLGFSGWSSMVRLTRRVPGSVVLRVV